MEAQEFREKLKILNALNRFRKNLWFEHRETIEEHVKHCNRIGIYHMYGYVFMGLSWGESFEEQYAREHGNYGKGIEYWYSVANAFGKEELTKQTNEQLQASNK